MSANVTVSRGPRDPICTRVSVGGNEEMGYYCTFRGSVNDSVDALRASLAVMEVMQRNGVDPEVDHRFKELGAS